MAKKATNTTIRGIDLSKPYRSILGVGYQNQGIEYRDLVHKTNGSAMSSDLAMSGTSIFYSIYNDPVPLTTRGDLVSHDGTSKVRVPVGSDGQVLTADSTDSEGLIWSTGIPAVGLAIYGTGEDGSLTLAADTTIANSYDNIKQYSSVTLAGFTLTANDNSGTLILLISGTLSLGGGTIARGTTGGGQVPASAGGTGASGGGSGGASGAGVNCVYVAARIITGTGTIHADGANGVAGSNATAASGTGNGNAGTTGTVVSASLWGNSSVVGVNTGGGSGGASGGGGPAGPSGDTGLTLANRAATRVIFPFLFPHGFNNTSTSGSANFAWDRTWTPAGGGGGAGASNNGGAQAGSGGAGGMGSAMWIAMSTGVTGNGGAGGNGAAGGSGAGGGGGGGGTSGGFVVVITESAPSTLTVRASGGTGGNGGNGNARGGGGGSGGGGGGGVALLVAPTNSATCTAAAGSPGTPGAPGADGGNSGGTGLSGSAGRASKIATR